MRSIPYSDIEKGVAAIAGIDPTSLLAHEKVLLAEYISDATKYCWDYYPWSEFTKTEKRYFRNAFVPSTSYKAGDEVYYDGKYYRARVDNSDAVIDITTVNWYEVGDTIGAPEWSPKGLYYKGAKVQLDGVMYICIDQPMSNIESHGEDPCSFDLNGIHITDTNYFEEIYNIFDRYIAYEQVGKDVIGTCLAITLEDPRYNDTKPLNWREDREGIYIYPNELTFNEVWVRYRLQAPVFTSQSADEDIPRFLAQAIKTFAYKHWLIGDGQHEKAVQQDMYGMDLLVRELDKLDSQQERGQPYVIIKNPYRRLNAKQGSVTPITEDQIGSLIEGETNIFIQVGTDVGAFNAVKRGYASMGMEVTTEVRGKNALKESTAEISTEIKLGKSIGLNVAVDAYPDAIGTRVKLGVPIAGRQKVIAYNAVKKANIKASQGRITCSTFTKGFKLNAVYWSGWDFPPPIIIIECENVIGEKKSPETSQVVASFSVGGTFAGKNAVIESQVTIGLAKSVTCNGRTAVVRENATISAGTISVTANGRNVLQKGNASIACEVSCTAFGRSSVVYASATSAIVVGSTSTGSNVVVRSEVTPMPISVQTTVNGRSSVVYGNASGLINLLVTTSVQGFEAVVIGFANSSFAVGLQASGYNSLTAGEATAAISIGLQNVERRRETSSSVVDMEIDLFLGEPNEIQPFDLSLLNDRNVYANWEGSGIAFTSLDAEETSIWVGNQYYARARDFFAEDSFVPVQKEDLPKYTFGSYGSGYTYDYLMADNAQAYQVDLIKNYKFQDDTILIRKTPIDLEIVRSDQSVAPVQGYLMAFQHQYMVDGNVVNGQTSWLRGGSTYTRTAGQYNNSNHNPTPQRDYVVQWKFAIVAPFYTNGLVKIDGVWQEDPRNGEFRSTSDQGFIETTPYSGAGHATVTTEYAWGVSGTFHAGYEDWLSGVDPLTNNTIWHRSMPMQYFHRFIYDKDVHGSGYANGEKQFAPLHASNNVDYNTLAYTNPYHPDASGHDCGWQGQYDNNNTDTWYHNPNDPADPMSETTGEAYNRTQKNGSNLPRRNFMFRIVPKKLKDRFPLTFENFISTEDYLGSPRFVEAVKDVQVSYPNTYSLDTSNQIGDQLLLPQGTFDLGTSNFTFSFWIYPENFTDANFEYKNLFGLRSAVASTTSILKVSVGKTYASVNVARTASGTTDSQNILFWDGSQIMDNNTWYHISIVKEGTGSNSIKYYLNGVMLIEGQITYADDLGVDNDSHSVGKADYTGSAFGGKIDEVSFWKRGLSATEISEVYNNGKPSDLSSLTPNGWWRMGDNDSGTGNVVTDQGSGGNDGTLFNNASFSLVTP